MSKLFVEFENENALRTYPFASGCTATDTDGSPIGPGILLDAAVYPVNASGTPYLSGIAPGGTVSISDDTGVIMTSTHVPGSRTLEFYDTSELRRHAATLMASSAEALSVLVNVYKERKFRKSATTFASTCVFPIVNDGVTSLNVGKSGALDGEVAFSNGPSDDVRVSTDGSTLRFDVVPIPASGLNSIQHIYCVVDGRTPFRIVKMENVLDDGSSDSSDSSPTSGGNTVALYLDNIDRADVCANAHREDTLEMADTCQECEEDSCYIPPEDPEAIPHTYQYEVVDVPHGTHNAFYLVVPNFLGYDNPLSITLSDGMTPPKTSVDIERGEDALKKLLDTVNSKGAVLQVPGLAKST